MRLPNSSAACFFYLDTGRKYVQFNQTTYPALQVYAVVNRAGSAMPITQYNPGAQPIWKANALTGQYSWRNNPGYQQLSNASGTAGASGIPGLIFNGSTSYIEYDGFANQFNGTETSLTVCCSVQLASTAGTQTIWALANTTNTNILTLRVASGNFQVVEVSSAGTTTVSSSLSADTNVHQLTLTRQGNVLSLYTDCRNQSASGTTTSAFSAYNTMTVGAQNSNGSVSNYLSGAIGSLLVYGGTVTGAADVGEVEIELAAKAGVVRVNDLTATVGI